ADCVGDLIVVTARLSQRTQFIQLRPNRRSLGRAMATRRSSGLSNNLLDTLPRNSTLICDSLIGCAGIVTSQNVERAVIRRNGRQLAETGGPRNSRQNSGCSFEPLGMQPIGLELTMKPPFVGKRAGDTRDNLQGFRRPNLKLLETLFRPLRAPDLDGADTIGAP